MTLHKRLERLEAQVQPPQAGNCYPGSDIRILTGNYAYDKQQNAIGNTRLYLDREWRIHAIDAILYALEDEQWHQSHHTDSWQGTRGVRELWPVLREGMTWKEKCIILDQLEKMNIVEKRRIESGTGLDIFPEYRLNKETLCTYNHALAA